MEFQQELSRHLNSPPFNFSSMSVAPQCHDATWALAWSLDKIIKGIASYTILYYSTNFVQHCELNTIILCLIAIPFSGESSEMDLSTLNYTSDTFTKEILKYMNNSFIGITVRHSWILLFTYLAIVTECMTLIVGKCSIR